MHQSYASPTERFLAKLVLFGVVLVALVALGIIWLIWILTRDNYLVRSLRVDDDVTINIYADAGLIEGAQGVTCEVKQGSGTAFRRTIYYIDRHSPEDPEDLDFKSARFNDGALIALYEAQDPFTLIMIWEPSSQIFWTAHGSEGRGRTQDPGEYLLRKVETATERDLYRLKLE